VAHVIIGRCRLSRLRTKNRNAMASVPQVERIGLVDVSNQVDLDNESVPDREVENHFWPVAESKHGAGKTSPHSMTACFRRVGPFGASIRVCGS
jgi:hypothetical protein